MTFYLSNKFFNLHQIDTNRKLFSFSKLQFIDWGCWISARLSNYFHKFGTTNTASSKKSFLMPQKLTLFKFLLKNQTRLS